MGAQSPWAGPDGSELQSLASSAGHATPPFAAVVTTVYDRVCLPPRATTAQTVWVVVQYLENNPIALPDEDSELVLRALENTYRCP